jgi:hypothetical protein
MVRAATKDIPSGRAPEDGERSAGEDVGDVRREERNSDMWFAKKNLLI